MKAVVMAGGEGTRLRPLTSLRPKPMVPIVNHPVMEHILGLVKHHGIDEVVATLAFMPQVIEDYFGNGEEWGMDISYALEETPLGTAGSIKNAQSLLEGDRFLVISGDALTDIDLSEVLRFHEEKGAAVTIALKRVPEPLEFGVVITAEDGRIERFLEKPSWGQVFSDTINTGIYVLESEVLDRIPDDEPFDFSSQLFPLLMEEGYPLYGCAVDGYWCDVGSLDTYMQVHRDILDQKAKIYIEGIKAREGLWVAEGAHIDPAATLGDKVVIGHNCVLRAGAHVGDYVVLGDNCVVGNDVAISHTIAWNDAFIGRNSEVQGAVLCRGVDIRARASVDVGAVIGDESMIGHGAQIGTGVQIYPYKRVEPAAVVRDSIIWENAGSRTLFGDIGVTGLVGVDVTPQMALKAAQAFGSILPKGSHVVVSRDSSRAARMIKRAMVAGLNSTGCSARDLRVSSPAINKFTTRDTRCVGGIHISQSADDPSVLDIQFYDKHGLDLAPWEQKKVERLYFRGEFRRAFLDEIGDIIYPPRALEYYSAGLKNALTDHEEEQGRWLKVVADLDYGVASLVLPQLSLSWHLDLITMNPFLDSERSRDSFPHETEEDIDLLKKMMETYGADFGVRFDAVGERLRFITETGRVLDHETAMLAVVDLWCRTDVSGLPVATTLHATSAIEKVAARHGRKVVRPGRTRRALAAALLKGDAGLAASTKGGFMFGKFLAGYDAVMTLGMVSHMLSVTGESLDEVVGALPEPRKIEIAVFCPADRKGAVMRAVTEAAVGKKTDLTEGVKVFEDDGWVLVLPHASEPTVIIYAEADDLPKTDALLDEWRSVVEGAISG